MRLVTLALSVAALAAAAEAQSPAPLVEPFRPNRTPLAATAEVPGGFELFVADPVSQALFNPARLGLSTRRGRRGRQGEPPAGRFVYGTVRPSAAVPAPAVDPWATPAAYPFPNTGAVFVPSRRTLYTPNAVAVAAAFGSDALRWVVTAEHQALLDRHDRDRALDIQEDAPSFRSEDSGTEDLDYHEARARVAAVGRAGAVGYSVGVFGGYRFAHREVSSFSLSREDRYPEMPLPEYSRSERERTTEQEGFDEAFGVGAEFGVASKRLDLVGTLSFQRRRARGTYLSDRFERSESASQFPDSLFVRRLVRDEDERGRTGFEANAFDGSLFTALYVGDGPEADAFTLEAFGTVGGGAATSVASTLYLNQYFEGSEGALELVQEDRTAFDGAASSLDPDGYHVGGALGYVHRRRFGRTAVVAGARLAAAGGRRRDAVAPGAIADYLYPRYPFQAVVEDAQADFFAATATLPLHAEAPVAGPFRLFGGGVFSYDLAYAKGRYDLRRGVTSPEVVEVQETYREEGRRFESDGRFYLGTRLRTKSGLAAQAAFRGSLSSFGGWTVSLGYHF